LRDVLKAISVNHAVLVHTIILKINSLALPNRCVADAARFSYRFTVRFTIYVGTVDRADGAMMILGVNGW
jgi:hypothetical protein